MERGEREFATRFSCRNGGPFSSEVLVFLVFLGVPLAASPSFWDQFTTVKWYVLGLLAATWFLVEVVLCRSNGWPRFVRKHKVTCTLLALVVLYSTLRSGIAWGAQPLLDRMTFVMLALCSFWYFSRNGLRMATVTLAVGIAAALVNIFGLAQILGLRPLPWLTAGDQRSAFFGNVNMAAEFLGFSVLLLLAEQGRRGDSTGRRGKAIASEILVVCSIVYLFFLSSRSVLLALTAAIAFHVLARTISIKALFRMLGGSALGVLLLIHVTLGWNPTGSSGAAPTHVLSASIQARKMENLRQRLSLWESSLRMIWDHPLGVGSANFGDAFIPYQARGRLSAREGVLFRSPHNEYIRVNAEDGLVFGAIAAVLAVGLLLELHRSPRIGRWRSDAGVFLGSALVFYAVEAFFQFPLALAFGSLMAATLLGLGLACLEGPVGSETATLAAEGGVRRIRRAWVSLGVLSAGLVFALLYRVAASEYLFVNMRDETWAQDRACQMHPRNLPACVHAAWLHAQAGDRRTARALLVQVVDRSPHYYPAIKLLGEEALVNGQREAGCFYLWTYNELFRGGSSVHEQIQRLCDVMTLESFSARVAIPHNGSLPRVKGDAGLR